MKREKADKGKFKEFKYLIPMGWTSRLYQKMKELNICAGVLGERIGIGRKSIYSWFDGISSPTLDTAIKLADVLGVSMDWLFRGGSK